MSLALKLIGAGLVSFTKGILILLTILCQAIFDALMAFAEFVSDIFTDVVGSLLFFAMVAMIILFVFLLTAPALA